MANSLSVFNCDVQINGNLKATTFSLPTSSVTDNSVQAAAGIQASKLQHQHQHTYCQELATTAVSESRVVHIVRGATATIQEFYVGITVANSGAATIVFDLHKSTGGGAFATVLSSTVTTNSSTTILTLISGSISSSSLVQGDILRVVVTATAGGGTLGKGPYAVVNVREDAQ